jgi:hypothetical protein
MTIPVFGDLDPSFTPYVSAQQIYKVVPLADGKIIAGYNAGTFVRLSADGTVDGTFTSAITPSAYYQLAAGAGGKLFFLGTYSDETRVVRLNEDGSIDGGFTSPTFDSLIKGAYQRSDGKLYVYGFFSSVGGVATAGSVVLLNTDGTRDLTFDPRVTFETQVLVEDTAGRIVVGGNMNTVGGVSRGQLIRISAAGVVDTGYVDLDAGDGFTGAVAACALEDGGVFATGSLCVHTRVSEAGVASVNIFPEINEGGTGSIGTVRQLSESTIFIQGLNFTLSGTTDAAIFDLDTGLIVPGEEIAFSGITCLGHISNSRALIASSAGGGLFSLDMYLSTPLPDPDACFWTDLVQVTEDCTP